MKLKDLNTNKYFIGVMMIILNLGSKHLVKELSSRQLNLFNKIVIRKVILFTVVFIATRDIYVSVITILFIIFINFIFNEDSQFGIISPISENEKISKEMYENAKKVVEKYLDDNLRSKFILLVPLFSGFYIAFAKIRIYI